jgi:protein-tyrosine phosphatase
MSNRMNQSQQQVIEAMRSRYAEGQPVRVLFVCLGNICRSPAAEGVMQALVDERGDSLRWVIDSAGTGNYHIGQLPDTRMRVHARRRGYELTHRCRQVQIGDFENFDVIFAMDSANQRDLQQLAPTVEGAAKVLPMSLMFNVATRYDYVPDPYYEGAEGFELVLDLLQSATEKFYAIITGNASLN